VVNQTFVIQIKFCGISPALRVAAKRYLQGYDDRAKNKKKTEKNTYILAK